jgi:hypothetical protein
MFLLAVVLLLQGSQAGDAQVCTLLGSIVVRLPEGQRISRCPPGYGVRTPASLPIMARILCQSLLQGASSTAPLVCQQQNADGPLLSQMDVVAWVAAQPRDTLPPAGKLQFSPPSLQPPRRSLELKRPNGLTPVNCSQVALPEPSSPVCLGAGNSTAGNLALLDVRVPWQLSACVCQAQGATPLDPLSLSRPWNQGARDAAAQLLQSCLLPGNANGTAAARLAEGAWTYNVQQPCQAFGGLAGQPMHPRVWSCQSRLPVLCVLDD